MQKRKLIACIIVFLACIVNVKAEYQWVKIYEYESTDPSDFVECNDETILPMVEPLIDPIAEDTIFLYRELTNGVTYKVKVYSNYSDICDSCFAVYDYVPESYEIDGFWTYANNGCLVSPDGYYGIYNMYCSQNGSEPIDWEDYPDYSEEELAGLWAQSGMHFTICTTGIFHVKIEVYDFQWVP